MAPRANSSQVVTVSLIYRAHEMSPHDLTSFLELRPFHRQWDELELNDVDLRALQILLMLNPTEHPVVKGTGGLRKMRFGRRNEGKSGGYRVCYAYYPQHNIVVFVAIYPKNEQANLTAAEREEIRVLLVQVGELLDQRPYNSGQTQGA